VMTQWEAIEKRVSCRTFRDMLPARELIDSLIERTRELAEESGADIRFVYSTDIGRPVVKLSPSMFSGGVYAAAALIGGTDPLSAEKLGYYGEELLLYAARLGLGTCWVAGTYEPDSIDVRPAEGERLWGVIPMGYAAEPTPMKQKMIRGALRAKSRKIESMIQGDCAFSDLPGWVRTGVEAVRMGPSAVNGQPVNIVYEGGRVFARIIKDNHGLQLNDLGIAKRQFEAGAAHCGVSGTWQWGDGAQFVVRQ